MIPSFANRHVPGPDRPHRIGWIQARALRPEPLRQQLREEELTEVARLDGLRPDRVAVAARGELKPLLLQPL